MRNKNDDTIFMTSRTPCVLKCNFTKNFEYVIRKAMVEWLLVYFLWISNRDNFAQDILDGYSIHLALFFIIMVCKNDMICRCDLKDQASRYRG